MHMVFPHLSGWSYNLYIRLWPMSIQPVPPQMDRLCELSDDFYATFTEFDNVWRLWVMSLVMMK